MRLLLALLLPAALLAIPAAVAREEERVVAGQRADVMAFFTGHTEGIGRMKIAVHGYGHVEADGTMVLDQIVEQYGKPRKRRVWRLREVAPGRYAGTLSDAAGPVVGTAAGNRLLLSYAMQGGWRAVQRIALAHDGRSAHNQLRVSSASTIPHVGTRPWAISAPRTSSGKRR